MTVAQLRHALKGLAPDTPVVLSDAQLFDLLGQAEVGINNAGRVRCVRLFTTKQVSRFQGDNLTWTTKE